MIVMREELEGWGVLFDPDTGDTFGLNAVSVFIWKGLEAKQSKSEILAGLTAACGGTLPESAALDFDDFVTELVGKGYATIE